jgi:type I restriction enzyme S subunit
MNTGYKQTEVGVIPEDWDVRHLVDVSRKITDGDHVTPQRESHGYYLLSARNVHNGRIDVSDVDYVGAAEYQRMKQRCGPESGDILISCSGTIGRVTVVPPDFECVLVRSAALAKIDHELADSTFLQFWLQGSKAQGQIASSVNQGAQPNLFLNHIERLACPHPPLPEQRAIATALNDVDGLLGALDQLVAKKRDLRQAAMQQLLTGQTRLPGFKGEWVVKTLGELFNFGGGYSASRDQLSTEGHCYLHYGDIHGTSKTCIDADADFQDIPKLDIPLKRVSSASLLADGDVVFVDASEDDAGTSKHVVVVNKSRKPFISGLHTIVAKSKTDELAHDYRRYCFQTPAIRQQFLFYAVGTKVSGISKSNIPKLTVSYPSLPEQTAIASVLSEMDAELAALEQRRDKTRALKQGMMQELLTGRTRLV